MPYIPKKGVLKKMNNNGIKFFISQISWIEAVVVIAALVSWGIFVAGIFVWRLIEWWFVG